MKNQSVMCLKMFTFMFPVSLKANKIKMFTFMFPVSSQATMMFQNCNIKQPFGNCGIGISASASALTSTSASALQTFYFVLRSLYFCISKFYMEKTSMVKYFSSTLANLLGRFS